MKKTRRSWLWVVAGLVTLGGTLAWLVAVVVLPDERKGMRGGVEATGYGLVLMVAVIVIILIVENREVKQSDRERVERRRARRRDRASRYESTGRSG